jgi:hypothetical protein
MAQEARFGTALTDAEIVRHLRAKADSLDLPDGAQVVRVRRSGRRIAIASEYVETVKFPLVARTLHFAPRVERTF